MKECLLSEEVQEEIGRGLGLIKDTAAAREVWSLLMNCSINNTLWTYSNFAVGCFHLLVIKFLK